MGSRVKTRPRSSSQRAPDRMPDLLLPSSDQRMRDTARQMQEIHDRRAAIAEESRRLDEKESSLSKIPLIRRLTSARSSVRKSKDALHAQLKEMDEEERRINAQLEREKMRAVEEEEEDEHVQINDDELAKAEAIILKRGRAMRNSVRRKSVTDLDTIREERDDLQREQKDNYAQEAGAWRSRVCELIGQIAARPTSYFLFKQAKNDDMPKLEEKLFCFAVKFVDQDRLAAEEDLQLRALYLLWKEFKEVVDTMEKRLMQSVDLETEEVAADADSCTDESSGDEAESILAPTETTDSESQVQRTSDYAREAEDFKRRVDQIFEEISEHPSSPPVAVSQQMIAQIKQVELPALSASLGRLLDKQLECDDDDLQWGALKIQWTRLRDAVDKRDNELKQLCETQQSASEYAREAERFRSCVDQIKELMTSTSCSDHNETFTMIRRIKREDLPALEAHLDRLLELLEECSYDGQQWPFETLVQEFTQLSNTVKTREFQILEQMSKINKGESTEENNETVEEFRVKSNEKDEPSILDEEEELNKAEQEEEESHHEDEEEPSETEQVDIEITNVIRWRTEEDSNGTGKDESQFDQSHFDRQSNRLSFHRRLHFEMEQTFKKKGMAAAAEVDGEEEKRKSRPFDINREIEEEVIRSLEVTEMRKRLEDEKRENEKEAAKLEFDKMRERWEELKKKRMEENKLEEEKRTKEKEEMKRLQEERKKRIEEEYRKKEEEEMRRLEEQKKKINEEEKRKKEEEDMRRLEEEMKKRIEEEEKKKKEEEDMRRLEEEKKKRMEEEKRKKEEEDMRRLEEEKKRRIEEEEKKTKEEEKKKRIEEEEKKKREDEEMRRLEEEKKRRIEEEEKKKKKEEEMRRLDEEKKKKIEDDKRKKEEEERNRRIEEEKQTILEEERMKKEEDEEIKKRVELEKRKNDQAEKIKRLDEDMKRKKEEIARVQNQLLERQKAAMDRKKEEEEARRRSREEKRLKGANQPVEPQVVRPRDASQQRQLLQTELQQKLKTTPLGKAAAADMAEEEDRERQRRNEMRRERDEEERKRAKLEQARRKDEDQRTAEQQNSLTTSSSNQRQLELEKRLKEMEQEALKRLAAEMAALKKEFGLDRSDGAPGGVGTSLRRIVSDEQLSSTQHPATTSPINTAPPATISHDPRSSLRAGIRERPSVIRASSRPRSVTFGDAQGKENVIAELTRSPSFRRMRAAHASEDEWEPEHQQSRF